MDDTYRINMAKTEFREGYNSGDVERVLSVFQDGFIDYYEGVASAYGPAAKEAWRGRLTELFSAYHVEANLIIYQIAIFGGMAFDRGAHEFVLTPKAGGEPVFRRERYVEIWKRTEAGDWKIFIFINNQDVPEIVNGIRSTWFLNQAGSRV